MVPEESVGLGVRLLDLVPSSRATETFAVVISPGGSILFTFPISCSSQKRTIRLPKRKFQFFIPARVWSFSCSCVANRSLKRNFYKRTYQNLKEKSNELESVTAR